MPKNYILPSSYILNPMKKHHFSSKSPKTLKYDIKDYITDIRPTGEYPVPY